MMLYGNCLVKADTIQEKLISLIKRMAVSLHLMPKTMKGKELFKRLFLGKLTPLPPEIDEGMAKYTPPVPISNMPNKDYKVIYAVGYVR